MPLDAHKGPAVLIAKRPGLLEAQAPVSSLNELDTQGDDERPSQRFGACTQHHAGLVGKQTSQLLQPQQSLVAHRTSCIVPFKLTTVLELSLPPPTLIK